MAVLNTRRAAVVAIGMIITLLMGPARALVPPSHAAQGQESVCPPPGALPGDVFPDDDGDVHEPAINCAAQYDLVDGFGWGGYGPGHSVTRGQMASMLVGFLDVAGADLPAASGAPDAFDDDSGSVHEFNINVLVALGVARGVNGRRFAPNRAVDRAQMTSFVVQALQQASGEALGEATDAFDDDTGSVHERSINALAAAGVVRGVAPRRFTPDAEVTRAQTASFVIGAAELLHDDGRWAPTHGAAVALDRREVAAGSAVTGAVMGGGVTTARVSGCGLQREALHDADADRAGLQFDAVVPFTQSPGDCVLMFAVSFVNARSQAVEETITVTSGRDGSTAPAGVNESGGDGTSDSDTTTAPVAAGGPMLTSCSRTGQRSPVDPHLELVTFEFDRDVVEVEQPSDPPPGAPGTPGAPGAPGMPGGYTAPPNASKVHAYRFDGTSYNASIIDTSGRQLTAQFAAEELHNTTLCTVDAGVVRDQAGAPNPIADAPLAPSDQPTRVTAAPDLESVGNFRIDPTGRVYADFFFDEPLVNEPAPQRFALLGSDGRQVRGSGVFVPTDPPGQDPFVPSASAISVQFPVTQQDLPFSQIARGVVQEDTVCDAGWRCNPLQAADARQEGSTTGPDLVSARVLNSGEVEFVFDEPVAVLQDPGELSPSSARFGIYDGAARWNVTAAAQSQSDPRVVVAQFDGTDGNVPSNRGTGAATDRGPVAIPLTGAIGAFVFDGAVRQVSSPSIAVTNRDDQVPLPAVDFLPGRTLRPDLTAVMVLADPISQERIVRYTFDGSVAEHLDGAPAVSPDGTSRADDFVCEDFVLYDAGGAGRYPSSSGGCTSGPAGSTATIRGVEGDTNSVDVYGAADATVDAAVLAAVNDVRLEWQNPPDGVTPNGANPQEAATRFPEGAELITRA